ncbi:MAG: roadblock/LC7 domain-containing protein [Candidatus Edwardsbacteria bacterium]|nr:roadblock/LC7 domain-containing protein [Candidatus Edwardsbacteria bacterium]
MDMANYEQRLKELVESIPGAASANLTGIDGIGIAAHNLDPGLDPTLADAEFATMLASANRAAGNLQVGDISELIFSTEKIMIILKMVGKDFYLGVGLQPGASNLGMARLQMRWAVEDFAKIIYAM